MLKIQEQVAEFSQVFNQYISDELITDTNRIQEILDSRTFILEEEFKEYLEARCDGDIVSIAHELIDVLYTLLGDACAIGIDIEKIFDVVHQANMSKLWPDCQPRFRPNGKIMRPSSYIKPDVASVLFSS